MARRTSKQDKLDALFRINNALCQLVSDINEVESETPGFTVPHGVREHASQIQLLLLKMMDKK